VSGTLYGVMSFIDRMVMKRWNPPGSASGLSISSNSAAVHIDQLLVCAADSR